MKSFLARLEKCQTGDLLELWYPGLTSEPRESLLIRFSNNVSFCVGTQGILLKKTILNDRDKVPSRFVITLLITDRPTVISDNLNRFFFKVVSKA